MELLQTLKHFYTQGIGVLRIAYEHSPYDLESFGIALPKAKEYAKLADSLLGPADSPRLQRESIVLAEQRQLSLDHLVMVNRHAKKLKQRGAAWKLRAELIAHEGSYKEVNAYGNRRVKEIQGEKPKEPGVKVSQAKNGMVTMTVTDTQRRITDFTKTLDAIETTNQPRSKALLEAFWKLIDGGGGILKPQYRTVIAIGLDQSAQIIRGEGNESIIGASDGTTMTGAEIVNLAMSGALGDKIYAGLFHPTAGPVNLYEARFASFKQRTLAKTENLVCPWPDCKVPADRCQVHHIDAHKNSGQTNPSNLSTLCAYHNGVNDDGDVPGKNFTRPKRGRTVRHRGKVKLLTPGGRLVGNMHDLSTMGAMNLI